MAIFDKTERDEFFRKNRELINSKNIKKVFQKVYAKAVQFDQKIFYDFLGEVLIEKPGLLDRKKLYKYLTFVKKAKIPVVRLIELESYLIEKYSLFDGEELLFSFNGDLRYRRYRYKGRLFITNYRIIVLGKVEEMGHALELLVGSFNSKMLPTDYEEKILKRRLPTEDSEEKAFIGWQFPIKNPRLEGRKREKELFFTSTVWVRGKKKEKERVLKFKIRSDKDKITKIKEILQSL